jgi:serine/threonine-protein kinase
VAAVSDTIGGYVIDRELGRGAFGVVYKAVHPDDPATPVALKVIRTGGKIDRLMLEPALLAKLDHPGVVRVLDYFPHAGGAELVIALEYVGGGDLKAAIDETDRFHEDAVRAVLEQIGGALAEAHAKGVVHRDLKPANILIDRTAAEPRYVLTDFGVGGEDEGIRSEKKLAGTLLFMAPEQLRGRPGPQSDLWALGVVAYRMLTGTYPFPGPTVAELSKQIQLTTPRLPSAVRGEPIDPVLERVVLRLLDRSETERIGSAADLLRELGHTGDTQTIRRSKTVTLNRIGGRVQSLDEQLRRRMRRHYLWAAVWATLYIVLAQSLQGIFALAGLVVFYLAHVRLNGWKRVGTIVAAFGLYGLSYAVGILLQMSTGGKTNLPQMMLGVEKYVPAALAGLVIVFGTVILVGGVFVFPVLACNSYAKANRVRRERVLLTAAGVTPDEYLALLRRELDYRYEDVNFHLRYAEGLAARGDDRGAAIEARLLLDQDPYHFTGNLLLAQCYFRLGLHADCRTVCDEYLAVAGYCFEFAELRRQCRPEGGAR